MKRTQCLALSLPALLAAAVLAQTPASPAPAPAVAQTPAAANLPTDPGAAMSLIADSNGLHGVKAKPWHLHATWKWQDAQGQVTDQGTLEEWWAAADRYKLIYTSGPIQQVIYGTRQGRMAVKSDATPSLPMENVQSLLQWPAPPLIRGPRGIRLQVAPWRTGGTSLQCVLEGFEAANGSLETAVDKSGKTEPAISRYCVDPGNGALRVRTSVSEVVTFNSVVRFQGQYVARSILSAPADGRKLQIDIDALETLDSVNNADVTPPADAVLVVHVLQVPVSSGVMNGNRMSGDAPTYPLFARDQHVEGTVVLQAVIREDGTVGDLKIVSGPGELQHAALEAVKTWRYRPYLLNGEPVQVVTQVNVNFSLGR